MIRPAALADLEAIFSMAFEESQAYENLRPDLQKMRKGIMMSISGANHFCYVSENEGRIDGALIGLTSQNLWAQRRNCFIAFWKALTPGDGAKLIREFKNWIRGRRGIRVAGLVPDSEHIDQRAYNIAERLGFEKCGGVYLLYN